MNNLRGAKIIYQESKATQPSHLYFLQKDENYCEAIVTSESGTKRKLNLNVDLSNYYKKTETYSKIEIDELLDSIEVTKPELDVLISENKLEPNRLYKITGVESWCFSQYLIKAIYLKAITNNTLESEGVGEFYTPKYNNSDSNIGIWKGELLSNGMISSASYNIGDKVIWGNLFWENISGNIGTNEKVYYDEENDETFFVKSQNFISETDWQLITPNDDESLYNIQFDAIKYDFQNDYINYRADNLGNIYEISYSNLLDFFPNTNIRYFVPEFIYNINSIALFQWGRGNTSNNIINESIVLNCNYTTSLFIFNTIVENSKMYDNNFLNVNVVRNTFKNASIVSNYLKTYGGILYNDLDNSYISSNRYYFEIRNNTLKNDSIISNNNDNNIIISANYSIIRGNSLDNNSTIINNIFVEEGKGVSGYRKGIYDNVLTTYCNINSNTIKNGSRIYGHTMNYYSTINGNTFDTDSNIYNNQIIQNSKINNNILTGHGRIYGNQLDRVSEITLCKLRISPTTSYATTMKNNRLFAGKIQNIDFGDIVNPVGSNPNDPNFGGNGLSECIIENESIIKDLTFPNHGGVGIQFVKMNGYSEFKNITINDSIKNVDFINTIFNETSDYSKLIQGSGYQTNGFTKTYIDGVLLQDKFNSINTEIVNVNNEITDLNNNLSTKLDKGTYTGTASDLLPYNGALQDVNIASNYFKTSKGFNFTFDENNYFRTFHDGIYNKLDFISNSSEFGDFKINANVEEGFNFQLNNNNFYINARLSGDFEYSIINKLNGLSNIFRVVDFETYSKQPYKTDSGFRITGGTANQALTADGGTFDLSTVSTFIEATKTELDNLISSSQLSKDSLYKISGVNSTLYGGTTIFLTAIENNKLSINGYGMFYNPKYDKSIDGFGIVKDYVFWKPFEEQTESGVYNIGDRVIWGGKHWNCISPTSIDTKYIIDKFNLDTIYFEKIPFNETDYNVVYDEIKYDYEHDLIIERNEQNSNIVSFSYDSLNRLSYDYFEGDLTKDNFIKNFQWGNVFDYNSYKGIGNNKIKDSLNENINFSGRSQINLTFTNYSYQINLTFTGDSGQYNLTFNNNSNQINLNFNNGYQSNLNFNSSSQGSLTFTNGSFQDRLTFTNGSSQYYLTFNNNSGQSYLRFNNNSGQSYLTFNNNSGQSYLIFTNSSSQGNLTLTDNVYQYNLTFKSYTYDRENLTLPQNEEGLTFDNTKQSIKLTGNEFFTGKTTNDFAQIGDLNLKLSTEAPSTTGTVISFSTDKVYGTLTTPETGNITADVTNAKLGVTNIIIHNSGTAPTFGSEFKKLSGSGKYSTGVVNYIYCTYISTTEIIYSINQRT